MGFWQRLWGAPTHDDFAAMVTKAMRGAGIEDPVYDRDGFALRSALGSTYLHNIYQDYLECPRRTRDALLKQFVRAVTAPQPSSRTYSRDEVLERLLPRVRARAFYEGLADQLAMDGQETTAEVIGYRSLCEHLAVGLVLDFPDHVSEVPHAHYEKYGIGLDEAYTRALENLQQISQQPYRRVGAGLYASPWQDNHDAARLLLPERIAALPLRGLPVVMAADRDHLLITGSRDEAGLAQMAAHGRELLSGSRAISAIPLCLVDEQWAPFVPERADAGYQAFTALRVTQLAQEYGSQRAQLRHRYEQQGEDVFVAGFSALEDDDGVPFSYCVWTRGVVTLLPQTDRVALLDPQADQEPLLCDWHDAMEAFGGLAEQVPAYPPRVRTSGFPSQAQLAALRQGAATSL